MASSLLQRWLRLYADEIRSVGVGIAACSEESACEGGAPGVVAAVSAALFGGMGTGVGALIKTERWKEAELPAQPPVALNVGRDGSVRLAFSLTL